MARALLPLLLAALTVPAAAQNWVSRYNGPANDEDLAWDVAAGDSGCVYVTGASWGTSSSNDFLTVKYGPDGGLRWESRINGAANGGDEARAIAARNGRVAVAGGSAAANLFTDFLTVAYSAAGDSQWAAVYNGPGDGNDHGLAVALDEAGNVYVTGYAYDDSTAWDFATIKYSAAGARQWVGRYATEYEDFASAVALDGSGNVYVTGSSGNPYLLTWDYATAKYNSAGVEQWAVRYNGPAGEDDEPHGLAVDRLGNVYVTGGSLDSTSGMDFATIKYGPAGETVWVRRYNGPGNGPDEANAVALDTAGNVYVAGFSQGTTTDADYATVKYDADGNQLWAERYDGPAGGFDEAKAIAVDDEGSVYVTGSSTGPGTRGDYATVKYDADGNEQWVRRYDGPAGRLDEAVAIVLDQAGGVCITGSSLGSGTGTDYATAR
ncbi:hypothetical protein FJY71_04435, partial [candidate division WOR-3 bacterium]|nr:hypothetical protein [candidate division WOR-3 bacterium]